MGDQVELISAINKVDFAVYNAFIDKQQGDMERLKQSGHTKEAFMEANRELVEKCGININQESNNVKPTKKTVIGDVCSAARTLPQTFAAAVHDQMVHRNMEIKRAKKS